MVATKALICYILWQKTQTLDICGRNWTDQSVNRLTSTPFQVVAPYKRIHAAVKEPHLVDRCPGRDNALRI